MIALPVFVLLLAANAPDRVEPPAVRSPKAPTALETGYRRMYNLEFADAHRSFRQWTEQHPADPMGPVSDAAAWLFGEFERLHILQSELFRRDDTFLNRRRPAPDPRVKPLFEASLDRSQRLVQSALALDPRDPNARLAGAIRAGLRADYLGLIEKHYLASVDEMKAGRNIAESLIADRPDLGDAYLAVGVENYILSQKAAPVRWFLHLGGAQTDYERGIRDVSIAAQKGHYLAPFARVLLAVAAVRANDTARARAMLSRLAAEFPRNPLYADELAKLH